MLDYFNIPYSRGSSEIYIPKYSYVKGEINTTLQREIDYHRAHPLWVPSNHILSQYIWTCDPLISQDDYSYYSWVRDSAIYKATDFGITTSLNQGVVHYGAFYGGDKEIILGITSPLEISQVKYHWQDLTPVQVLRHQYNTVDYQPIIKKDDNTSSINVILIDFTKLLFQYKYFRQYYPEDTMISFLYRYPLTNMLRSHVKQCVLNNFISKVLTQDSYYTRKRNTIRTANAYTDQLNQVTNIAIATLEKLSYDIGHVLKCTPLIDGTTLQEHCKYQYTQLTRQNTWGYIYSSLPYLRYALHLDSHHVNSTSLQNLKSIMRRMESDSVWSQPVFSHVKKKILREIDDVISFT